MKILDTEQINFFKNKGYLILKDFVSQLDVKKYLKEMELLLTGSIDVGNQRNDLGGHKKKNTKNENITQIMLPSDFIPSLKKSIFFNKSKEVSIELLGRDMKRDMDMYIEKYPNTNTATPWHQDSAYWPKGMKDKRSLSCWLALDNAIIDNGCMWYVPGSHLEKTRIHKFAGKKSHALVAECDEKEGVPCPIKMSDMIIHDGRTLHYSRGNTTSQRRRALITNYRSKEMIEWERSIGFDHRNEEKN